MRVGFFSFIFFCGKLENMWKIYYLDLPFVKVPSWQSLIAKVPLARFFPFTSFLGDCIVKSERLHTVALFFSVNWEINLKFSLIKRLILLKGRFVYFYRLGQKMTFAASVAATRALTGRVVHTFFFAKNLKSY